jgi:hypothetical protein
VAFTLPHAGWSAEADDAAGPFQPIAQLTDPSRGECSLLDHAGTSYDADWSEVWQRVQGSYELRSDPAEADPEAYRDGEAPGAEDYTFERLWLPSADAVRLEYVEPGRDGYRSRMVEYWLVAPEGTVQLTCAADNTLVEPPMTEADLTAAQADFAAIAESIEFLPQAAR